MKHKAWFIGVVGLSVAMFAACGDDEDTASDDDGSGGSTTTSTSNTSSQQSSTAMSSSQMSSSVSSSSSSGAGGGGPFMCVDTSTLQIDTTNMIPCQAPDQTGCECNGCLGQCVGDQQDITTYSDCVCPECATDPYCSDPNQACNMDGSCDPFNEGCACADCANHPLCP